MFQIKINEKLILWPSIYISYNSFINQYLNLKFNDKIKLNDYIRQNVI